MRRHLIGLRKQGCGPFDVPRRTRELEVAYEEMWRQHAWGVAPRSFDVGPAGVVYNPGAPFG
jgi:hypothetical protein